MLAFFSLSALLASSLFSTARADPTPIAPGPGAIFNEGGQCTFSWTPDPSGVWKTMNVELMTGSNLAMVHLTTVASLDGTNPTLTTFSYACPSVTPNSAIYFYQFTSPASTNRTWTTRFTIADATGGTTPPTNPTQPGGAAIPWGTGALANPADATPAPPNGGGAAAPAGPASSSASLPSTSVAPTTTPAYTPPAPVTTAAAATTTPNTAAAAAATETAAGAQNGAVGAGVGIVKVLGATVVCAAALVVGLL